MFMVSHISSATLICHRLPPPSFSSILIIPYLCHQFFHHPPVYLLQPLSHHFPSSPRASSTFFSHIPLFHSALLVPSCLLWFTFLSPRFYNLSTMICYSLFVPLFLLRFDLLAIILSASVFATSLRSASTNSAHYPQLYMLCSDPYVSYHVCLLWS